MYAVLVVIHIIVSIFLIVVILLQAGRGGGLADTFGGSQMQSMFGTKSATVLQKMTTVCAAMFIITCLSLAILSSYRSKSLMEKFVIPEAQQQTVDIDVSGVEEETPAVPAPAPEGAGGGPDETGTE